MPNMEKKRIMHRLEEVILILIIILNVLDFFEILPADIDFAKKIISWTALGYKSLATIKDKTCNAELAKFQIDLKNLDKTVKFGDVKEFTYQVPCNSNEILFFDLKQRDKIISSLTNLNPIITDSIESEVEKNVFVVKNNRILSSFYAGNLDIEFPNYICFLPKSGKIDFIVEGKGTSVSVVGGCLQPECTYFPVQPTEEDAVEILNDAVGFDEEPDSDCGKQGKSSCPSDVKDEFTKFLRTKENVKIFRKYEYCRETGETNVEILIKPDKGVVDKEFRFYESIPKECIDDLNKYLSTQIRGEVSIKFDPLIIWSFDDVKEEKKLRYILDTILSEGCRESIEGMGISNLLEEDVEVTLPSDDKIDEIIKELTNLNLEIDDITLSFTNSKSEINLLPLTTYNGDKKHLKYSIVGANENDVIECDTIGNNKILKCNLIDDARGNVESTLPLTFEVTNGQVTEQYILNVNVIPTCVDDCSIQAKQCIDQTNFQECILVDGCFKWSPSISCDANFECVDDGQCKEIAAVIPKVASLSASFSNLQKNTGTIPPRVTTGANWWYFDVTLSETGGDVGITIQKRQRCYTSNNPSFPSWCDPEKTDIATWYSTDYISSGNQINGPNQWAWFEKDRFTYTVTETFWGLDDNDNNLQTSYSFTVTSD